MNRLTVEATSQGSRGSLSQVAIGAHRLHIRTSREAAYGGATRPPSRRRRARSARRKYTGSGFNFDVKIMLSQTPSLQRF
jgi:hypothetical protein